MTLYIAISIVILSLIATAVGFVSMADPEGRGGLVALLSLVVGILSTIGGLIWLVALLASRT